MYELPGSLAVLKEVRKDNVNTNVILYTIFGFLLKLLRTFISFKYIFQGFSLDFKNTVFHNPFQWLFPKESTWHMKLFA